MVFYDYIFDYLIYETELLGDLETSYPEYYKELKEYYPEVQYPTPIPIPTMLTGTWHRDEPVSAPKTLEDIGYLIGGPKRLFLSSYFTDLNKFYTFVNSILWSVEPYYKKPVKKPRIRDIYDRPSSVPIRIAYDSGGFQHLSARMSGKEIPTYLNPEKCMAIYKSLGYKPNDLLMQLDFPILPHENEDQLNTDNLNNLIRMQTINPNVIPIIHGWTRAGIQKQLDKITDKSTNKHQLAFGTFVFINGTLFRKKLTEQGVNLEGIEKKNYMRIAYMMKQNLDKELFLLGAGSPQLAHIFFANGITLLDGASYRLDATYFRIYIYEKTPIGVSTGREVARKKTAADIRFLDDLVNGLYNNPELGLVYPISEVLKHKTGEELLELLANDFTSRAIHNAFVCHLEVQKANSFMGDRTAYLSYLKHRFKDSAYYKRHLNLFLEAWKSIETKEIDVRIVKHPVKRKPKGLEMHFKGYL